MSEFFVKYGPQGNVYIETATKTRLFIIIVEMDKKALHRWEKILEAYFYAPQMSENWRYKVQQLLLDDSFEMEKSAALEKYFNKFFVKNGGEGNVYIETEQKSKQ